MQSETFVDGHCERHTVRVRRELCVVVQTDVAQFLDGIPNTLPLCGGSEREHSLSDDLHPILCKIPAHHTCTEGLAGWHPREDREMPSPRGNQRTNARVSACRSRTWISATQKLRPSTRDATSTPGSDMCPAFVWRPGLPALHNKRAGMSALCFRVRCWILS